MVALLVDCSNCRTNSFRKCDPCDLRNAEDRRPMQLFGCCASGWGGRGKKKGERIIDHLWTRWFPVFFLLNPTGWNSSIQIFFPRDKFLYKLRSTLVRSPYLQRIVIRRRYFDPTNSQIKIFPPWKRISPSFNTNFRISQIPSSRLIIANILETDSIKSGDDLSQSKRFFLSSSPFIRPPRRNAPNLRRRPFSTLPLAIFQRSSHSGKIIRSPRFPWKRVAGALSPASVISRVLLVSLSTLPRPLPRLHPRHAFHPPFLRELFRGDGYEHIYIYTKLLEVRVCEKVGTIGIDTYHLSLLL